MKAYSAALLCALALASTACAGDPPTITPVPPTGAAGVPDAAGAPAGDEDFAPYTVELLNTQLAVSQGYERAALKIMDQTGSPVYDGTVEAAFYRIRGSGSEWARYASGEALYFGGAMADGGAWVAYTDFDASGEWGLEVTATRANGERGQARMAFEVLGRTTAPRLGERPTAGDTPVLSEGGDPATVTSDPEPDAAMYAMTVAEAADSGKPSVVVFASPAHCPTALCAQVLDAVKQSRPRYGDRVNFLHVETRDLASPEEPSAAMVAWDLRTEPWTYLLGKDGRVVSRVEGGLDQLELGLLVDRALGQ